MNYVSFSHNTPAEASIPTKPKQRFQISNNNSPISTHSLLHDDDIAIEIYVHKHFSCHFCREKKVGIGILPYLPFYLPSFISKTSSSSQPYVHYYIIAFESRQERDDKKRKKWLNGKWRR